MLLSEIWLLHDLNFSLYDYFNGNSLGLLNKRYGVSMFVKNGLSVLDAKVLLIISILYNELE